MPLLLHTHRPPTAGARPLRVRTTTLATRPTTLPSLRASPISITLQPTGSGSTDHLDGGEPVPLPPPLPLAEGVYELGREEPADVVLPIPTVSTRHAMLRVTAGPPPTLTLTDLGSTNGTYVIPAGTPPEDEDSIRQLKAMAPTAVPPGATVVFGDAFLARFLVVEGDGGSGSGSAPAA